MQKNKLYGMTILLVSIMTLFIIGCENKLPTEVDSQNLGELSTGTEKQDWEDNQSYITIAQARADNPRDFIPDLLGDTVTVQGSITSPNFDSNGNTWHLIQDSTTAMQLFGNISLPALKMGDEIVATGVIGQYHGSTYINIQSASDLQIIGKTTPKVPKKICAPDLDDIVGEDIEGELVVLENVTIVDGDQYPPQGSHGFISVVDSEGNNATVFIDKNIDIDGSVTPIGLLNVTGVVVQWTDATPPDNIYWLVPRGRFDIK